MNYKVGQVLYLCNEESMKIIPLQVIEEIIRTTVEGSEKNYILLFPDNKKTKINLDKIKGKVFDNIEQIRDHMIKNATDAINRMATAAEILQKRAFNVEESTKEIKESKGVQVDNNNDIITVDLGDGLKGKISKSTLKEVSNKWK